MLGTYPDRIFLRILLLKSFEYIYFLIFQVISLSPNLKIMISGHIIFGENFVFENMISRADIKSLPRYGLKGV